MKKILKRIISIFCAISLALVPIPAQAQEGAKISAEVVSAYVGSYAYLNITGSGFEKLAALDLAVYYNPEVFSVSSAETYGISEATVDVNLENPGEINLSMASPEGISGEVTLLEIVFEVNSEAKPGDYPIGIAVGDAFNTELKPVSISRKNGKITVLEWENDYVPTADFYSSPSDYYLEEGDETTVTYYSYSHYDMASGVFEITYDKELLEFVEFGTYEAMETADSVYSVNSDRAGYVKIAYSSSTSVGWGDLFYVKLRAISDCDASTTVEMTPSSLFAQDLSTINAEKRTSTINITKKYVAPEPEDLPDFWVEVPKKVVEGLEFEATVKIAGESKAAAGDFVVNYNKEDFTCVSVTAHPDVSENGGMAVINKDFANGEVKFSFVNEDGVSEDSGLVVVKFVPKKEGAYSSDITTGTRGTVYDAEYNKVELDYTETIVNVSRKSILGIEMESLPEKTIYTEGDTLDVTGGKIKVIYDNKTFEIIDITESMVGEFESSKIGEQTIGVSFEGFSTSFSVIINAHDCEYKSDKTEPTCSEKGYTTYTCIICEESYTDDYIDALGHNEVIDKAVESTCTETGFTEGKHCDRCGEVLVAQEVVPVINHSYEPVITEPTCTEQGYTTHTCSVCGDSYVDSYVEIKHTFGEWYTIKEETHTEPGEKRRDCENCEHYETQEIPAKGYEIGDINLDGDIDVKDVYYARLVAAKLVVPTEQQVTIGDTDGDGKITAIDANIIRKFAAKIISSLPIEQ